MGCFLSLDHSSNSIFLPLYTYQHIKPNLSYERYSKLFFLSNHLLIGSDCVIVPGTRSLLVEERHLTFFHVES